jgi:DNA-3-methyladenine glycosylase I
MPKGPDDDTQHESRCPWVTPDPDYVRYHDEEWGRPVYEEHRLFELLTLEGAQAGLSWLTILRKRDGYRRAFASFDPAKIAQFDDARVEELMQDASIVRHRGKIESTINNARCLLELQANGGSLRSLTWDPVGGQPRIHHWNDLADVPAQTGLSTTLSEALKTLGFRFVGPTTVYAYLQAAGVVNDHLTTCFLHPDRQRITDP